MLARSAVAFCCWILFLDGLFVLILDELAESLISVLAICTGVGFCVSILELRLRAFGGVFPFEPQWAWRFLVDDSCCASRLIGLPLF